MHGYRVSQTSLLLAFTEVTEYNSIPGNKCSYLSYSERKLFHSCRSIDKEGDALFSTPTSIYFIQKQRNSSLKEAGFNYCSFYNNGTLTSAKPGQSHSTISCSVSKNVPHILSEYARSASEKVTGLQKRLLCSMTSAVTLIIEFSGIKSLFR